MTEHSSQRETWFSDLVSAGFTLMDLLPGTKVPYELNWPRKKYDPFMTVEDVSDNFGVVLDETKLVIDVDAKNFPPGRNPYEDLLADLGVEGFDTYIVRSRKHAKGGQDSLHIYFNKPKDIAVKKHVTERYTNALEFLSTGCFVVGPGSTNPDYNNALYEVIHGSPDKLMDAPTDLLNIIRKVKREPVDKSVQTERITDTEACEKRFLNYLTAHPGATQGDRNNTCYRVACKGFDFGVPATKVCEFILGQWLPKCAPMLTPEEVLQIVESAFKHKKDQYGNKAPPKSFEGPLPELGEVPHTFSDPKNNQHQKDAAYGAEISGVVYDYVPKVIMKYNETTNTSSRETIQVRDNTIKNVYGHFRHHSFGTWHNELYKIFRYNTFLEQVEFVRKAPWHDDRDYDWGVWRDSDMNNLLAYFSQGNWNPSEQTVWRGVLKSAQDNKYHPLQARFERHKWDGVERMNGLFAYYMNAADDEYTRAVARIYLIGAVARAMRPGSKVDTMPILEGKTGCGKSTFCAIVGGQYHGELSLENTNNKDFALCLNQIWICEVSEMTHARRSDVELVKKAVSQTHDLIRRPYGHAAEQLPRKTVFIGTMNPNHDNQYLKDQTGNRRFLPIAVGNLRKEELERDMDQIWAEAYHAYKKGELWHMTDPRLLAMATAQQSARTEGEAWMDNIAEWLRYNGPVDFLSRECITTNILNLPARMINSSVTQRVAIAMRALGWKRCQKRVDGVNTRGYSPNYDDDLEDV